MTIPTESPHITQLKTRCHGGEENFKLDEHTTCIFSATSSKAVSLQNYADLTLPDRLIDLVLRRKSVQVSWQDIRKLWLETLRSSSSEANLHQLYHNMLRHLREALQQSDIVNLSDAIQQMTVRSLLPTLVKGLSERDLNAIYADQQNKLTFLLDPNPVRTGWMQRINMMRCSMRAAAVFKKHIKLRANGKKPRQSDLLDGCVELLPPLGLDRALDAIVTVHTAVNGPPGAALSCLALELYRQPLWRERIQKELAPLPLTTFLQAPFKQAPLLFAFVREVLRVWNVPVVARSARTEMEIAGQKIARDSAIIMSPYFIHRNPEYWSEPDSFKPERWLEEKEMQPGTYVPFGWAPKSCIGSQLGLFQMMLLGHLLCLKFDFMLNENAQPHVVMTALPTPVGFDGTLLERSEGTCDEV